MLKHLQTKKKKKTSPSDKLTSKTGSYSFWTRQSSSNITQVPASLIATQNSSIWGTKPLLKSFPVFLQITLKLPSLCKSIVLSFPWNVLSCAWNGKIQDLHVNYRSKRNISKHLLLRPCQEVRQTPEQRDVTFRFHKQTFWGGDIKQ